jgi:hypothetical protein
MFLLLVIFQTSAVVVPKWMSTYVIDLVLKCPYSLQFLIPCAVTDKEKSDQLFQCLGDGAIKSLPKCLNQEYFNGHFADWYINCLIIAHVH